MGKKLKDISPLQVVKEKAGDIAQPEDIADTHPQEKSSKTKTGISSSTTAETENVDRSIDKKTSKNEEDVPKSPAKPTTEKRVTKSTSVKDKTSENVDALDSSSDKEELPNAEDVAANGTLKECQTQDYGELFTYSRNGMQFGIPIQNVQEVIRDFGEISELPIDLKACIGSIIYRNKLIPVFESKQLSNSLSAVDENIPKERMSLIRVMIEDIEVCFTMDKHIDVVSSQFTSDKKIGAKDGHSKTFGYIKNTIGYKNSNLSVIFLEKIWTALELNLSSQDVIDTTDVFEDQQSKIISKSQKEFIFARIYDFHFVVEISSVIEIIEGYDVTQLHSTNNFVRGLLNLRGQVIACIDISSSLGCEKLIIDERNKYLVLNHHQFEFALCVNEVIGIRSFDTNSFVSASTILGDDVSGLFSGVSEQDEHTLLQLSPESIIASPMLNAYKLEKSD
ncbi:hypothetical protein GN278_01460 [Rhodobacteraceae bacterium Araon29]